MSSAWGGKKKGNDKKLKTKKNAKQLRGSETKKKKKSKEGHRVFQGKVRLVTC